MKYCNEDEMETEQQDYDTNGAVDAADADVDAGFWCWQNHMSETSRQSLMDQITCLQHEVKALQYELLTTSERRDIDLQRYEERKQRTKTKLMKARWRTKK